MSESPSAPTTAVAPAAPATPPTPVTPASSGAPAAGAKAEPKAAPAKAPDAKADAGKEKPAEPHQFKVKIDGVEQELTLSELQRGYGSNKAAQKKFAEAAEIQKTSQAILDEFKKNPRGAVS